MFKKVKKMFNQMSVDEKLEALYKKLSEEREIRSLKDHKGWIKVVEVLRSTADTIDGEIISLCASPSGNADKLFYLKSNRDAIYALIGIVNKADRDVKTIIEKINIIEEKLEEAASLGQTK